MSAELLLESAKLGGVKIIAIVDDAYDPPKPSEVSENAFNQFKLLLEDNEPLFEELSSASGITEDDLDDWEEFVAKEELLTTLWGNFVGTKVEPEISPEVRAILKKLFDDVALDRLSKLTQLKPLDNLLKDIEGRVIRLGSDPDPKVVAKTDVVFLDLYLSEDIPAEVNPETPIPRNSYEKARDKAIEYLKAVREVTAKDLRTNAPAFILISSQGTDKKAENFRKSAGQMASRFRFVSKQNLRDNRPHEILAIRDIFRTCSACAIVEPIQKAWPEISRKAAEWIQQKIFELEISDFGHLYHLRLQKEGKPINDYVKEIIAGAVAEQICRAFSDLNLPAQEKNPFDGIVSYFDAPSNGFAELYETTRISRDLGYRGKTKFEPRSGDLFLEGLLPKMKNTSIAGRRIVAVMSPPCDLIDHGGKGPKAKSVLLLEGTIMPSTFQQNDDPQMLYVNDRYYEIAWAIKHPSAMKIEILRKRWEAHEYTWLGQLRGEHFIDLKTRFLSDLGRFGINKSPSVYEPLGGEISVTDAGHKVMLGDRFSELSRFGFLCADGSKKFEKQHIAFTGSFLGFLVEVLKEAMQDMQISAATREKLQLIITDKMSHLLKLIDRKSPAEHSLQNYLTVELHNSSESLAIENTNGILVIRVWPE